MHIQSKTMQSNQSNQALSNTLVIEAWINPHALTPSLIVHNLELQGIQLPHSVTVTIDRGHYDCMGVNYAVVGVRTVAISSTSNSSPFYCSFFSQTATRDMDANELRSHWLGNCCIFIGADFETHVSSCSHRHEADHVKTWRKIEAEAEAEAEASNAVSVSPTPNKAKGTNAKDNLRIIQLQKKNLALSTELGAVKAELGLVKAELGLVKAELGLVKEELGLVKEELGAELSAVKAMLGTTNLAQRLNEHEVWIKRANQCMQDWTNKGIIDRVWILETQHAYLRSEHLKHKEQQQQQRLEQQQHLVFQQQQQQHLVFQQQQQQQPQKNDYKCCKSLRKKLKKQQERLTRLEANEANRNVVNESCNKCNKCNDDDNKWNCNPFDFNAIYDHYDQNHYMENACTTRRDDDPECPALDLIANHYEDFVPDVPVAVPNPDTDEDDACDDDMFELIQISNFDLPLAK
jgi:hypothetical protein